jgi:hypothetical protein
MGDFFYPLARGPWLKSFLLSSPSDRLPGGEYTGELILKMNNSTNISCTPVLLLMVATRTRRSGLMKKTRHKKFHDTITLNSRHRYPRSQDHSKLLVARTAPYYFMDRNYSFIVTLHPRTCLFFSTTNRSYNFTHASLLQLCGAGAARSRNFWLELDSEPE